MIPNPELMVIYLELRINQVRSLLVSKLLNSESDNTDLWRRIFDATLWQSQEPLRKINSLDQFSTFPKDRFSTPKRLVFQFKNNFGNTGGGGDGQKLDEKSLRLLAKHFEVPLRKFHRKDVAERNTWITDDFELSRHSKAQFKRRFNAKFQRPFERHTPDSDLFRETRLRGISNQCLQGLLEDCSSSEECREHLMEEAGGYSLAHQTLYFILAKQVNQTILLEV